MPFTTPWNFTGKSDVVNLAASYAATEKLRLMTQLEYVRAENYYHAAGFSVHRYNAVHGSAGVQRSHKRDSTESRPDSIT